MIYILFLTSEMHASFTKLLSFCPMLIRTVVYSLTEKEYFTRVYTFLLSYTNNWLFYVKKTSLIRPTKHDVSLILLSIFFLYKHRYLKNVKKRFLFFYRIFLVYSQICFNSQHRKKAMMYFFILTLSKKSFIYFYVHFNTQIYIRWTNIRKGAGGPLVVATALDQADTKLGSVRRIKTFRMYRISDSPHDFTFRPQSNFFNDLFVRMTCKLKSNQ